MIEEQALGIAHAPLWYLQRTGYWLGQNYHELRRHVFPSPKADNYESGTGNMKVTLRGRVPFSKMLPNDRVMAAYWHACVCYLEGMPMSNASLRARFGSDAPSTPTISRLIRDTVAEALIKLYNPNSGRKYATYVPIWA